MILKVNRKDIPTGSDNPIFDYCRTLVANGVNPATRLEVYRERDTFDVAITTIGWGAKKVISDGYLRTYRASHKKKVLQSVPSPVGAFK